MKILYIKSGSINEASGGGLEAQKILKALQHLTHKAGFSLYIASGDDNQTNISLRVRKSKYKDILARVFLHSTYVYLDWRFGDIKKKILNLKPEILVLGNSRLGFVARELKKELPELKIICHYDNVEYDYVEGVFLNSNCITKTIEKAAVYRDEAAAWKYCDYHILLSYRDQQRLGDIYGPNNKETVILPICLPQEDTGLKTDPTSMIHLVFLGSLWYKSNEEAVTWFINQVWEKLRSRFPNCTLTIAGSRPSKILARRLENNPHIRFFPNYNKKEEVLFANSIFIAPIQTGAGMKVKVAEALSLGFPIIASPEALIGYEEVLNDPMHLGVIYEAEKPDDYLISVHDIIEHQQFGENQHKARALFEKYYSLKRAVSTMEKVIADLIV
jgi:glycosyltransferase involved in cell wall biosynthesis